MCKLAENAYKDVNIAFADEISLMCDSMGIRAERLIALTSTSRVNILAPGVVLVGTA